MTSDEVFSVIQQHNEVVISLLARLVWTPDKVSEIVIRGKRNLEAYLTAYNAIDGSKTVTQLALLAGVAHQTMSAMYIRSFMTASY